jgi:hypothetical protein
MPPKHMIKKTLKLTAAIMLLLIGFNLLRLSFPHYEISEMLKVKQELEKNGVNLKEGGVVVAEVAHGSPAQLSDIQIFDRITVFNNVEIKSSVQLKEIIDQYVDETIFLTVCNHSGCRLTELKLDNSWQTPIQDGEKMFMYQNALGITVVDADNYNRSLAVIIIDKFYAAYTGQDIMSVLFGPKVVVVRWFTTLAAGLLVYSAILVIYKLLRN